MLSESSSSRPSYRENSIDSSFDFADAFRRDLQAGFPAVVVHAYTRRHLEFLEKLPPSTEYRDRAIRDVEAFLAENKGAKS